MLDPKILFFSNLPPTSVNGVYTILFEVPFDLPYFDGHFPGNPVLPAAAILDATQVFLGRVLGKEIGFRSIPSAKFLGIITPGTSLRVTRSPSEKTDWDITWTQV